MGVILELYKGYIGISEKIYIGVILELHRGHIGIAPMLKHHNS